MMDKITRRLFLRNSAAAGAAAAVGTPAVVEAAPSPVLPSDPVFARYVAFLAHEHRAALIAMNRAHYERNADLNPTPPMFWFPEDRDVQCMIQKRNEPERRARAVLHAVGLCIPPMTWFPAGGRANG
jgi:hypothetical protein